MCRCCILIVYKMIIKNRPIYKIYDRNCDLLIERLINAHTHTHTHIEISIHIHNLNQDYLNQLKVEII